MSEHGAPDYDSSRLDKRRMILQLHLIDWTATPASTFGAAAACTGDGQGDGPGSLYVTSVARESESGAASCDM